MGFSLENEIHAALKPLLAKAKSRNTNKFSHVVSTLVTNQSKAATPVTAATKTVTTQVFINPLIDTNIKIKERYNSFAT